MAHTRRRPALRAAIILLLALLATAAGVFAPIVGRSIRLAHRSRLTGLNYTSELYRLPERLAGDNTTAVNLFRSFGRREWTVQREMAPYESMNVRTGPSATPTHPERTPPRWAEIPPPEPGAGRSVHAFGWPLPCMCFRSEFMRAYAPPPPGSLSVGPRFTSARTTRGLATAKLGPYFLIVPKLPLWPNLLANLALFAALFYALTLIPPARRALRRRRGHCPACNYPLDTLSPLPLCPECGEPRDTARAPSKGGKATNHNPWAQERHGTRPPPVNPGGMG